MLTPIEVRQLSQTSAWNTWKAILSDWLIIGGLFFLGIRFPHPLTYLLIVILMARQQLALGLLMHDAAHGRFFKSRAWNDSICQFFCAGPLFFSLYSYKHSHLKHHLNPLAPDDPDFSLIGGYPISKKSFMRKVFRDLSGQSYLKFLKYFLYRSHQRGRRGEPQDKKKSTRSESNILSLPLIVFSMVFTHLILLGALSVLGHPGLYFLLWTLPSMTFLQLYLRIRGIAEHAGYHPHADQRMNSRTVLNPVQTFFCAPHFANYHLEHHLYPSAPCFQLPKVHKLMKSRGSIPAASLYTGYGQVIRELIR